MTEIIDLPDLAEEIKKIWSSSHRWRKNQRLIEFSLDTSYGDVWFPYYQAPTNVIIYVKAWQKLNEPS